MKSVQLTLGGLLAGAAAGAAAATDDVGRAGTAWTKRMAWLLALAVVDLGSCGLSYLAVMGGGAAMMTPIPWLLVLVPGYVLAYRYKRSGDPAGSANDPRY